MNYKNNINNIASKFNPSVNEWQDSIYTFNKNNLDYTLYNKNKILYLLLNNYFNSNNKHENSQRNSIIGNMKDNIISLYTKNIKEKKCYNNINKLHNLISINKAYELNIIKRNYLYSIRRKKILLSWKNKLILSKNFNILNKKILSTLSLKRIFINMPYIKHTNNSILILVYIFNKKKMYLKSKLRKLKLICKLDKSDEHILKYIKSKLSNNKISLNNILKKISNIRNYKHNYFLLKRAIERITVKKSVNILLKKTYLANIYLNNNKLNLFNLTNLKNIIYKIYNKKATINITNIKYVYLENSIFVDSIIRKLNDRKKGVLRILKKALKLIKVGDINSTLFFKEDKEKKYINNTININKYSKYINEYLNNKYKIILKSIKNIHVIGISLEAKGRLTKRMTASRSVYKLKSKGNLKNIYSNYYKISTLLLRGFIGSNLNIVKRDSKNKNGSYSISSKLNTF